MKRNNLILWGIFLVALLIFSIFKLNEESNLRKNKKYTIGTILEISENSYKIRRGYIITYKYQIGEKTYKKEAYYGGNQYCKKLIGKSFPLIYSIDNVENGVIIIYKVTADLYEVPYPDSLRWVYKCRDY